MSEKKYSYLPNSYTIKFFKLSNENQKSFKPLLIINNLKTKENQLDSSSNKKNKQQNNKTKLIEKPIYNKKNYLLIQKRKKAIDIYLNNKKNSSIKKNQENNKYINSNKVSENHSLSSLKKIPHQPWRINHSFQDLKIKKKTNIISQIKNNEKDNTNKKKKYCKTDKESNSATKINKENYNSNNNTIDKNEENKNNTTNSVVIESKLENKIIVKENKYKTTEKNKNKSNNIFKKDISMKDNCFDIDNSHKDNNIKVIKLSLINEKKIENNKENKEIRAFKPNMNIFKDIKYNKDLKFFTDKNWKTNKVINLNNKTYNMEKINHIGKRNNSEINKNSENKINYKENQINKYEYNNSNNHPIESYKNPYSELSLFTFKKEEMYIDNKNSSLLAEKRKNELKKLINFTNKF